MKAILLATSVGMGAWLLLGAASVSPGQLKDNSPTAIQRATIAFRVGVPQWLPEERFRELLAMFEKYRGVTDEITFFTSATHPPLPLVEIQKRSQVLAERIVRARQLGYRAGINVPTSG